MEHNDSSNDNDNKPNSVRVLRKEEKAPPKQQNGKRSSRFCCTLPSLRSNLRKIQRFKFIKCLQVVLGLYIVIATFTPVGTFGPIGGFVDPTSGFIIDTTSAARTEAGLIAVSADGTATRPIVAATIFQLCCLAVSRISAFIMYPALVLVFTTKFRATMSFLSTTPFSLCLQMDTHDLHAYCGWVIFADGWLHTIFHLARWMQQGTLLQLVTTHQTGITGLVTFLSLNLICLPMMINAIRSRIRFEVRKYLHYLFFLFAGALALHVPKAANPGAGFTSYIFPTLILWYIGDWMYVQLFMTEKIDTTIFQVLPTGVQMTMQVSEAFQKRGTGGYCYVCLPWVSKSQWHAYSLFENPAKEDERQVFMLKAGDWTSSVHEVLQRDTRRPVWVQGPFHSPYRNAEEYDNQILVASGIGITPALSVLHAHKDSRRTNLIWSTRDPAMLEFFLEHAYLDHKGWNLIFYTGDPSLLSNTIEDLLGTNLCLVRSRPDLRKVITNIIYGVESKDGLPERYLAGQKEQVRIQLAERLRQLDEDEMFLTPELKMSALAAYAQDLGFLFTGLMSDEDSNVMDSADRMLQSFRETGDKSVLCDGAASFLSEDGTSFVAPSMISRRSIMEQPRDPSGRRASSVLPRRRKRTPQWRSTVAPNFRPWEDIAPAETFVKGLDVSKVLSTWGVLYCGGSKVIEKALHDVAEDLQVDFHSESFAW